MMTCRPRTFLAAGVVLLAVTLTYSNHFHNKFEFDDFHTITENVFVRSMANVSRFFVDVRTSSVYPTQREWRPLVTTSLALDYWLAKGYDVFYFHLSTFLWFVTLLILTALLFQTVLNKSAPDPWGFWIAWFATAWYGLHPAIAETVNYIIQRADLMSTWGLVAGLTMYARFPGLRRWGIYLVPVTIGLLCKPPAVIFPALLVAYIFLFEKGPGRASWVLIMRRAFPAVTLTLIFLIFQFTLDPKPLAPGYLSAYRYLITQPYVWFRYFVAFFLPLHLTADTDLAPVESVFTLEALGGILFVVFILFCIYILSQRVTARPAAFGLVWFVLGLLPTSAYPLAEVENDHRMFLPFVGLVLTASWAIVWIAKRHWGSREVRAAAVSGGIILLLLYAAGTRRRNEVWHTPNSLWEDVTVKSPRNGRGLMNYGLARMSDADYSSALMYFERALQYTPNYPQLEINVGIDYAALGRETEAEQHFKRAVYLAPSDAETHYFYARWLTGQGRESEAVKELLSVIGLSPTYLEARIVLMQIYAHQGSWVLLKSLAKESIELAPGDPTVRRFVDIDTTETLPVSLPGGSQSPETLLNLSLAAYQRSDFEGCVQFAKMALKLRPEYAEAYNNLIAANNSLGRWDDAINAAHEALRIKPDFQLARNNLLWAESHKNQRAR